MLFGLNNKCQESVINTYARHQWQILIVLMDQNLNVWMEFLIFAVDKFQKPGYAYLHLWFSAAMIKSTDDSTKTKII